MKTRLYFATSNKHKLAEANHALGMRLAQADIDLMEIQDASVRRVARHKAEQAHSILKRPVIVEDTGLYLVGLNGFPGALVKWLVGSVGPRGLCRIVDRLGTRRAYAETCAAFNDGKRTRIFTGRVYGSIAENPSGKTGFGWDAVFVPKGHTKTFAQMGRAEKGAISMRGIAFRKLKKALLR